jgi:voltage-gated potassium channel
MAVRKRVFEIIEKSQDNDLASTVFDYAVIFLIIANIGAVIASSFSGFSAEHKTALFWFEFFSVIIFTAEYALRFWTAPCKFPGAKHPYLEFAFSFLALIDLFAILPFYLPYILPVDLRFLRILRLFRLLRIFKLGRYNSAMDLIGRVMRNEKDKILTTLFITIIMILLASSAMYYVENEAQPDQFPNIPATIWWAVATLTTVGYGDVYPVTILGKVLGGMIAILGIGLVALPTGIISSGFIGEIGRKKICPHCGKEIE